VWLLAVAALRDAGAAGLPVGVAQLIPTTALVLEVAALVDLGSAPFGPAASDNASGTAVAVALAGALDAAPAFPGRLAGLPAIAIGCVDERGPAPRSHQAADRPQALNASAMDALLELALTLVDGIDAELRLSGRSAALRAAA
jgi:hypothetical protein